MSAGKKPDGRLRAAYLLRIHSYVDIAVISMWTNNPRVDVMLGMVEASLRGGSPGGADDAVLEAVRPLVSEARAYLADGEFLAAMGRMRVAHDTLALYVIQLADD
ncbi:hypothetical protein GBA63_08080 [Rubrobacter tropicus]|uniref:Uncharacterized protein n=1 Tax=Rubrobacter tropicus TaxID=2653851 RepID=A0A6G8Q7Z2_9ACTN|nr:hypothetical protein [Rubrobacter tropicus]QIN82604.1 hypothetical protein GBA63_08080 [Rubrobacter tropicus]